MANVTPSEPAEQHPEQTRSAAHRLGKCPICDYNLRGLPNTHRCPECGWFYDAQTRIWRPLKPKVIFGGFVGLICGGSQLVQFIFQAPRLWIPVCALWIGLASYLGWRCYLIYKRGQFVCVGPDGIRYRLQKTEAQLILWKDIASIHRQRFDKLCRIERIGGQQHIVLQGAFASAADTMEFAELANQRLTAHLKNLASEPPSA
ncbi:MAG: hypothetical protein IID41_12065 [Planctomycetes bacterium]|nr:hypothetical protein [Planctomycetota bacterium]